MIKRNQRNQNVTFCQPVFLYKSSHYEIRLRSYVVTSEIYDQLFLISCSSFSTLRVLGDRINLRNLRNNVTFKNISSKIDIIRGSGGYVLVTLVTLIFYLQLNLPNLYQILYPPG